MSTLSWIILATLVDSIVAVIGVISLWMSTKTVNKIILSLVALATGALLAGAILHLFHESFERLSYTTSSGILLFGFVLFFITEKFIHWHHCMEEGKCKKVRTKSFVNLILLGDGLHNFIDGIIIAASFLISIPFGIITTFLVIGHEIPQEIGDFAILVYGGLKRRKALWYNFLSQATCVFGGIVGYYISSTYDLSFYLLSFAAGGFIYIAAADLIPELHKEKGFWKTLLLFLIGIFIIVGLKVLVH